MTARGQRKGHPEATYAYGVLRGPRPSTTSAPGGLPGTHRLRAIDVGDGLWLIAADAPLTLYSSAAIDGGLRDLEWVSERAMRHEAVVEHFARRATVVPMKLFTLFDDDARAVSHVRRVRRRLGRIADRVSGCAEWGVRIHADPRAVVRAATKGSGRTTSGLAFLRRKKAQHEAVRDAAGKLSAAADRVLEDLSAHAREALTRPITGTAADKTLLLDGVLLVPATAVKGFRAAAARAAKSVAPMGLAVTLTGPWPPYHFVGSKA